MQKAVVAEHPAERTQSNSPDPLILSATQEEAERKQFEDKLLARSRGGVAAELLRARWRLDLVEKRARELDLTLAAPVSSPREEWHTTVEAERRPAAPAVPVLSPMSSPALSPVSEAESRAAKVLPPWLGGPSPNHKRPSKQQKRKRGGNSPAHFKQW